MPDEAHTWYGSASRSHAGGGSTSFERQVSSTSSTGSVWWDHRNVTVLVCFLGMLMIGAGYAFGVLNGALVLIKKDLRSTTLEIAMMVSSTQFGALVGAPVGSFAADKCGRRPALMATCLLLAVGPLCMAFSTQMWMVIASRALVGVGIGMSLVTINMYVAEVSPREMRGRLTTLESIFMEIGILSGFLMNYLLLGVKNDWRWMVGLGSLLPFVVALGLPCPQTPESPRWLSLHGRGDEASLTVESFMLTPIRTVSTSAQPFVTWGHVLCPQSLSRRRMLLASVSVTFAQVACGFLIVTYYSSDIMKTTMSERAAFLATLVMGAMKLSVTVVVLNVLESVGRRPMFLASIAITMLSCLWLACAFLRSWGWLAQAAGFSLFMVGFSLGQGPITYLYCSEVFETEVRAKGMGISVVVGKTGGMLSTLLFPLLVDSIGISACFFLLVGMNVVALVIVWCFMVETSGGSLQDVDKVFGKGATPQQTPLHGAHIMTPLHSG